MNDCHYPAAELQAFRPFIEAIMRIDQLRMAHEDACEACSQEQLNVR